MKKYQALYCSISQDGGLYCIHYYAGPLRPDGCHEWENASRQGYSLETFNDVPKGTPLIDYRTADAGKVMRVIFGTDGVREEQPSARTTFAEYARLMEEAGATIGEI